MDDKVTADNGAQVTTGLDDRAAQRRQSAFARRKSSAVVEEAAAIVEAHTLNDADRRLAEMGYTQVGIIQLLQRRWTDNPSNIRSISENSPGCQPSPSPSPSPDSSPVSPQPSSTHSRQAVRLQPCGPG